MSYPARAEGLGKYDKDGFMECPSFSDESKIEMEVEEIYFEYPSTKRNTQKNKKQLERVNAIYLRCPLKFKPIESIEI